MRTRVYAEQAARVVNGDLAGAISALGGPASAPEMTDRETFVLRGFVRDLRPVFDAAGDVRLVVQRLNDLLLARPITPRILDDGTDLGLGVAGRSVAETLIAQCLLGLAALVCDLGPSRVGVCADRGCDRAWVDLSPGGSRRFCSERCASRTHVAAHRARRESVRRLDR